jgi:high-affinity Fe2+/Pb2+ permease
MTGKKPGKRWRGWILETGCWLLAAGHWLLATGHWLLATGWQQNSKYEPAISNDSNTADTMDIN